MTSRPPRNLYADRFGKAALVPLMALYPGCAGPCPDKSSPAEGSCTCSDGTAVKASECDACEGSGPQDLGVVGDTDADQSGTIIAACERSFDFALTKNAAVTLKLSRAGESLSGALASGSDVALGQVAAAKNSDGILVRNLSKGSYNFLLHSAAAAKSNFRLELHATPYEDEPEPEPGSSQDSAFPVGSVTDLVALSGFVGVTDPVDYFVFNIEKSGTFTYALTDVSGNVRVQLFLNASIINEGEPYRFVDASTNTNATREVNLEKGEYFLRVTPTATDSLYKLRLSSTAYAVSDLDPEPPDDWTMARDVGRIPYSPVVSIGGFVGGPDRSDFYRLELESNGPLTYTLHNVAGRVQATLYEAATQIDTAQHIDQATSSTDDVTSSPVLKAGTYYLRVTAYDSSSPSLYTLVLSAGNG